MLCSSAPGNLAPSLHALARFDASIEIPRPTRSEVSPYELAILLADRRGLYIEESLDASFVLTTERGHN